jgi:hypothetical protein
LKTFNFQIKMTFTSLGILTLLGMFCGTLCMVEIGRHIQAGWLARNPDGAKISTGTIDAAVFGLLGLLIAFTFSGAATRFDTRRTMIVDEANCISTAWSRLDLLPAAAQPPLREKFRQYVDARLTAFRKIPDMAEVKKELDCATSLQNEIWTESLAASRDTNAFFAAPLLMPALNQMFDSATSRTAGIRMHPPMIVYVTLAVLTLAASLLAGAGMGVGRSRDWIHGLAFVMVMTLTVYVIVDFEFPRVGLIRIQSADQVMIDLRESMKP